MRLFYCVSARENTLYDGQFLKFGRYKTFGQHSFIYDFAACAARAGVQIELLVEGLDEFPIAEPLKRFTRVHEFAAYKDHLSNADAIIWDTVSDEMADATPTGKPIVSIVHNAGRHETPTILGRSDCLICMTENAVSWQSKYAGSTVLALIHQGIDLARFASEPKRRSTGRPKVLCYTRTLGAKRKTLYEALDRLLELDCTITLIGDGALFWETSDRYGTRLTLIDFIPCHSIHTFLKSFDLVVSSGRGAMEALACDLPVLCAGYGYAGPITRDNVPDLLRYNLTGFGAERDMELLPMDVKAALGIAPLTCRRLAEEFFDGERFVQKFQLLAQSIQQGLPSNGIGPKGRVGVME